MHLRIFTLSSRVLLLSLPSRSTDIVTRPNFSDIVEILDSMLTGEKDGETKKKKPKNKFVSALIDRHSTWF